MNPLTIAALTFLAVFGVILAALAIFGIAAFAVSSGEEVIDLTDDPPIRKDKDEAECCKAHALPDGRPVIGYCGPDCERRPR